MIKHLTFCVSFSAAFPLHPPQVTGSSEPIRVAPGDYAILPCWVSPKRNASRMTVEWSKSGQYVLVYKGHGVDNDAMNNSYVSRTSLFLSELEVGNLSLKLNNVTFNDSGSFKCFLPRWRKSHEVQLIVDSSWSRAENVNSSKLPDIITRRDRWPVAIPIVLFLVVFVMTCYMCVLYDKWK
uniref:Uncharacterized LOC110367441 n=1 Tax=Fundulus heteroclitus TaxID=8078 RepID=A0A3Q2QA70_FUNHE